MRRACLVEHGSAALLVAEVRVVVEADVHAWSCVREPRHEEGSSDGDEAKL
jgi:hypothetical protein